MNQVFETIDSRVSLRRYKDKDITPQHMDIILQSALKAPTAGNMMLYSIIKVTNRETKEILSNSCDNQPFIKDANAILIFVCDLQKWFDYFSLCGIEKVKSPGINDFMLGVNDALIACQNAVLTAESLGIGSCYIGDIMENYEIHKELLNLPDYAFPAAMITLGYYPDNFKRVDKGRFDGKYVIFDEKYNNLSEDELKEMFKVKEQNMPKTNTLGAENFGQLVYKRKIISDFSKEMDRSIRAGINNFTKSKL